MKPGLVDRPVGTGDFLIMYFHTVVRAGVSDETPQERRQMLFIWTPGARQYYGHQHRGYLHTWIHCHGPLVESLLGKGRLPGLTPLIVPADSFLAFIRDIHAELSTEKPDSVIAGNLFENWVRTTARTLHAPEATASAPLRDVREYIDRHFAEDLSLAELARKAHLSKSHFSAQFRRHFGASPIDYLIRRRLGHAVYLLRDINLSVSEVASRVGYQDIFYFSKLFKKIYGSSPRAFRRST